MKTHYRTITKAEDEQVIKKSRFKTFVYNIGSEEEANAIIADLRMKYKDATHVCYAYILSAAVVVERFSDDGEPSGTAGIPMLEVIKNSGYSEVLAVVVRYFGGVKLGAGGLVRAYADSVKNCLLKAQPSLFMLSDIYEFSLDFSLTKKINQLLMNVVCKTLSISYNELGAKFQIASPQGSEFFKLLNDFCLGRVKIETHPKTFIEYDSSLEIN